MGGGGGYEGMNKLQIASATQADPRTQQREEHLWRQAERFAETGPFSREYGGAAAMPGMSPMARMGQQYLTNQIFGPGAYGQGWKDPYGDPDTALNLGFTPYGRPEAADAAVTDFRYGASGYTPGQDFGGPTWVEGDGGGTVVDPSDPPVDTGPPVTDPRLAARAAQLKLDPNIGLTGPTPTEEQRAAFEAEQERYANQQAAAAAAAASYTPDVPVTPAIPIPDDPLVPPYIPPIARPSMPSATRPPDDTRVDDPWVPPYTPPPITQPPITQPPITDPPIIDPPIIDPPIIDPAPGGGLLGPAYPVGIGEMVEGTEATRDLLAEETPGIPEYDRITAPTIGGTTVGDVADIGAIGQAVAPEAYGLDEVEPENIGLTTVAAPAGIGAEAIDAPTGFGLRDVAAPELAGVMGADIERITGRDIAGPAGVTVDPVTGQVTQAVGAVTPGMIAGPGGVTVDPVTGQTTQAVGGVTPGEFGGASFFGGPAIQDYMNVAGTEAAVTQARQDYEIALNREKARQAQVGAFGARGTVEEAGLIEAQERNIAQIRGAGFERAAQMMESETTRRQQAGLQSQQLEAQTSLAGQALEAQRRESDAARAQQAALSGRELQTRADLEQRQLTQAAATRQAELGVQTGLAGQTLEAQRREADAARAQQAALAGQQWSAQTGMQTQELQQRAAIEGAQNALTAAQSNQQAVMQSGTQEQQLEAARQTEQARLGLSAAQGTQQLEAETGIRTQELETQVAVQNAQNALSASQSNLTAAMQSGDRQAQIDAQRQMRDAELGVETAMQTQQVRMEAGRYTQQAQTQVAMQNAQNQIRVAEQNMQSALQTGDRQAMIDAQRQQEQARMGLDAATRNQYAGLQAGGLGLDAQAQFRQQQMDAARQMAVLGGMRQGATFDTAGQLAAMGGQQESAQQLQQAWDYDQWLRRQGGAEEMAFVQSMMPGGVQQTWERKPSTWGQIGGGLLAAGGLGVKAYAASQPISDIRLKENIELVGNKNGFNLYEFNYLSMPTRYRGVMAHEVARTRPDAVIARDGVLRVDYDAIDVQMELV